MIGAIMVLAYFLLLGRLSTSDLRRKGILIPAVAVMCPAGCFFGETKYDEIQGARTTARAAQLKGDVDRRFPIGTEQRVVNGYFSGWLHENERDNTEDNRGWYNPEWWRFGDEAYAYRNDGTLMLLMGQLPSPSFGCGRMRVYLQINFKDHKLATTEITTQRPDCL